MAAGLSAQAQAMPASIPVIDIGALYGSDDAAKKAVAAKLIILLPVASRAPYDFIVSHFEARGALA